MTEPQRWLEPGSAVSPRIRRLLEAAEKPRNMRPDEHARAWQTMESIETQNALPLRYSFLFRRSRVMIPIIVVVMLAALAAAAAPYLAKLFSDKWMRTNHLVQTAESKPRPAPLTIAPAASGSMPEVQSTQREKPPPNPINSAVVAPAERAPFGRQPSGAGVPGPTAHHDASILNDPSMPKADARDEPLQAPAPEAPTSVTPPKKNILVEVEQAEQARRLVSSNPAAAIALLDRIARDFPSGVTWFARERLYVEALRRLGREAEAASRESALETRLNGKPKQEKTQPLPENGP